MVSRALEVHGFTDGYSMKNQIFTIFALLLPLTAGCTTIHRSKYSKKSTRSAGEIHRSDVQPPKAAPAPASGTFAAVPGSNSPNGSNTPNAVNTSNLPNRPASEVVPQADNCQALILNADSEGNVSSTPPVTSPSNNFVVTKFFRPCATREGLPGMERNSAWLAMGFPCSGGEGRVDWKGTHYQRPKLVELIVANDCPMGPPDQQILKGLANKEMGIPLDSTVGAYTPFMVQFWEIPSLSKSDVGFSIELRDTEGLTTTWGKMIKGEALRVVLIGRENAWTQTDHLYQVEADILITAKNRFRLKPASVKVMTSKDIEAARSRCEALRPARNCTGVFQL